MPTACASNAAGGQCDGDSDGGGFLRRKFLLATGDNVEEHPHRRRVLHDDGDGDTGSLNRDVIKIIGRGHAEHAEQQALDDLAQRELDALPSPPAYEKRKQHQ